jgi:hypothetical protein
MMVISGRAEVDRVSGGMVLGGLAEALRPLDGGIWMMVHKEMKNDFQSIIVSPSVSPLL